MNRDRDVEGGSKRGEVKHGKRTTENVKRIADAKKWVLTFADFFV